MTGSDAWLFSRMTPVDRQEVSSDCFRDAYFSPNGRLDCFHQGRPGRTFTRCEEEYLCEIFAALLLMPQSHFQEELTNQYLRGEEGVVTPELEEYLSDLFEVELWVVRFRILLLEPINGGSVIHSKADLLIHFAETYDST